MPDVFIKRTDGLNNRAAATNPLHLFLDTLCDLSQRLQHHEGDGIDILERYDFFVRNSNKGRACTFSHKCQQLFLTGDYEDIKKKLLDVIESIRQLPGEEDFGR